MRSAAVARVCDKLEGLKETGTGWVARCPAHDDRHASLSIGVGTDGRVLVHCHAGCTPGAILDALGMRLVDLFPSSTEAKEGHPPLRVYSYYDAAGTLLYEVCRYPNKGFKQRRPDGQGGWLWSLTGVTRVPYRLPELQGQTRVAIVEGEKDADRLWSLGIPATTNAGGAGKWKRGETELLRHAGCQHVIILPDNDAPGRKHGETVAQLCHAAGMAVTLVTLPGLGPGGDVSDWLDAGHTEAELRALMAKPYVVPETFVPPAGQVPSPSAAPPEEPLAARWKQTDLGNAEAFLAHFGDVVRYDRASREWLVWGGHTWLRGADAEVRCLAHEHVRRWQGEAHAITDYIKRKSLLDYLHRLEGSGKFDAMLKEAAVKPSVAIRGGWDESPLLLGTPTGVIDLGTGLFRDGTPGDMITKRTGVGYDPEAICPRWEQFVREVFQDDEALVAYVQRVVGYCLTGVTSEQCFFMAYGTGANGKSTFLVTLDHVFGDYAHTTDIRTFTVGSDNVPYEVAMLAGRRLIATSEARTRSHLNEQILKNFTGGEKVEAQHKYGHPFTFKPMGKIWFAVNHAPKVSDESHGFWRRVRLVPFTRTFSGVAEDRTLGDKLRAEAAGILRWAVEGCRRWLSEGLNPPASVVTATEAYQQAENPVADFLQEECLVSSGLSVRAGVLYQRYAAWAKRNGLEREALTGTAFGRHMSRNFSFEERARGKYYIGVGVRAEDSMRQDDD